MLAHPRHALSREAQLISSFADTYQRRFADLIARSNAEHRLDNQAALSLCIETMGLLVDSHARLARMLSEIEAVAPSFPAVPALKAA